MSTITDVAKAAGVSKSTVSLVLTKSPKVHPDTKAKILKAMEELNYRPRHSARDLAGRKTNTIGVLSIVDPCRIPNYYSFKDWVIVFFEDVILGIEEATRGTDYSLQFARQITIDDNDLITKSSHVDGLLVVTGRWNRELIDFVQKVEVPVVITGGNVSIRKGNCVFVDDCKAAEHAVCYLISKGHSRIALINSNNLSVNTTPKFNGYANCLREHGIPVDPEIIINSEFSAEAGKRSMQKILAHPDRPTAVMCASDGIAIGAAHAILDAGLRIPEDIAVMGFEDSWLASHFHPPLSTIHIPKHEIGKLMVQEVIGLIEGTRQSGLTTLLETEIIERSST